MDNKEKLVIDGNEELDPMHSDYSDNDDMDLLYEVTHEKHKSKEPKKKRKLISILVEIIFYVVLLYVCAIIIPNYVIQRTIVDGPSMENSLHDKENVLVEKFLYKSKGLERFDIVVFYPYGRESSDYYVKRVIGLPGETVQIIGSEIYINGEVLDENYGKDKITNAGLAKNPITLSDDEIFVLGDNRDISLDSRYEEVGPVPLDYIGGKVIFRILPLNKFGTVD